MVTIGLAHYSEKDALPVWQGAASLSRKDNA